MPEVSGCVSLFFRIEDFNSAIFMYQEYRLDLPGSLSPFKQKMDVFRACAAYDPYGGARRLFPIEKAEFLFGGIKFQVFSQLGKTPLILNEKGLTDFIGFQSLEEAGDKFHGILLQLFKRPPGLPCEKVPAP